MLIFQYCVVDYNKLRNSPLFNTPCRINIKVHFRSVSKRSVIRAVDSNYSSVKIQRSNNSNLSLIMENNHKNQYQRRVLQASEGI